ncbi:MAG: Holliday junction resolvase RuvX [Clostridiaceae bacterium]|nr:Holliday junction resolvase RuvX [Clostridiaceae bacterium]
MRVLAVDYGDARTGIAISDPTGFLAGETTVIASYRLEVVAEEIANLCAKSGAELVVVGRPLNMNGTVGERAEKAEGFAATLREVTGLPVELWDERLTSVDANRILSDAGKKHAKQRARVDAVAASLILEGYLSYMKSRKG